MTDFLEFQVDKFTFRVATDRYYTQEGLWAKQETARIRIGISDYLQQRSGDVAFAEVKPVGSAIAVGGEIIVIETIKVDISLTSPLDGEVVEVNPAMQTTPEIINQDPYEGGWLTVIQPAPGGLIRINYWIRRSTSLKSSVRLNRRRNANDLR